jgi:hypothetical protein
MYDAQQGSTSGAHIDISTASGTNNMHGSAYVHRGTDALNAAPYFYNADPNIPANDKVPELHRYTAGGTFGAPIIKDKLFGYVSFQHTHDSDQEIGSSRVAVPPGLTDSIRNNPAALAALVNGNFPDATTTNATVGTDPGDINPIAYGLLNYKLANGQYLIPSASTNPAVNPISINFPENAFTIGTSYFIADQGVADLDWNVNAKDTLNIPARSEYRSIRVFRFTRIHPAPRCGQPGSLDNEYSDYYAASQHCGGFRLHTREGLQHHRPAVYATAV